MSPIWSLKTQGIWKIDEKLKMKVFILLKSYSVRCNYAQGKFTNENICIGTSW